MCFYRLHHQMETGNLEVNWVWALMMAAPRWEVQLALVLLHALLHKAAQGIVAPAIGRYLDCKPWTQGIIARCLACQFGVYAYSLRFVVDRALVQSNAD